MFWKATSLGYLKRLDDAIALYNLVIEKSPHIDQIERALVNKAQLLHAKGKIDEAIKCFSSAVKLNPKNVDTWLMKGMELNFCSSSE